MMTSSLCAPVFPSVHRSLSHVVGADGLIHAAADLLDPLDAAGLTTLRDRTQRDRNTGLRSVHCPNCDTALSVVVRPYGTTGIAGGGRAFFRHCGSAAARACVAATDNSRTPGAIDAARFDGRQEGPRHRAHKTLLAAILENDPRFTQVAVERSVRHGDATRYPDVQARLGDMAIAFEVQHASPLLTTIQARTDFYAAAGYGLVWLVDGNAAEQMLVLQGFQDLTWLQSGQILALDDAGLAAAMHHGSAQAVLITLHQTHDRLHLTRERIDLAEGIARIAPAAGGGLPPIASDFASRQVFAALRDGGCIPIRAALEHLCRRAALPHTGREAESCGLPAVIAALGTLLTGCRWDASGFGTHDAAAILNNFLSTRRHAVWAPLLARAAGDSPRAAGLLARDSTARKLAAALDRVAGDPPVPDPVIFWAPVIAHLFPQLGRAGMCRAAIDTTR